MKRLFALLLLIAAILLVLTGVILMSASPVRGLPFLIPGLALGGFAFWLDHGRAKAEKERLQEIIRAAETAGRFEANLRQRELLLVSGFLVVMSLGCIYAGASKPDGGLLLSGVGMALLFGYIGWHALRLSMQPSPAFSLDMRGLHHVQYGTMPWQDIAGVALKQITVKGRTISSLIVGVRQPHHFVGQLPLFARWRYRGWRPGQPATGDIEIPLNNLDQPPEAILAAARAMLKRHNPDASPLWHAGMSARDLDTCTRLEQLNREMAALQDASGPSGEAAMAALSLRMEALAPEMQRLTRDMHDRAIRQRNQSRLVLIVTVILLALWIAAKML